ncbi:hypothetical protein C1Y63_11740 [Corynebacterium sp. 13CS0277]|nr:hypothetical protein C1Y63_11740 [Corynebacterium sp. 13CS0277]
MAEHLRGRRDGNSALAILDVGCGTGLVADALRTALGDKASVALYGVDPSPQMRAQAERRGLTTVDSLPTAAGQWSAAMDVVVSSLALHHMSGSSVIFGVA